MFNALFSVLGLAFFNAPPPAMGLEFVPPEQLRAIPLAELPYAGFQLPDQVDLAPRMPPAGHQQRQNSCVAWASAYAVKTYQEKQEQRYQLVKDGQPDWQRIFSPAFVYNQINQGRDGGSTLVEALNLLSSRGALSWSAMPYNPDDYQRLPTTSQLKSARRFRISYWRQVNVADPQELKSHLQAGFPLMVGALIDEGFYRLPKGKLWQRPQGKALGGHALVVVGYDDHKQAFKVFNSWGSQWSDNGFGWISYRHFAKVVREGYVAKDALNQSPLLVSSSPSLDKPLEQPLSATPAPTNADDGESAGQSYVQEEEQELLTERKLQPEANVALSEAFDFNNSDWGRHHEPGLTDAPSQRYRLSAEQLQFQGQFNLPTPGQQAQILVYLYQDPQGQQPLQLAEPFYRLANQQGVAFSPHYPLSPETTQYDWSARLPLKLLPAGLKTLWAQPVLYIDRFGLQRGALQKIQLAP